MSQENTARALDDAAPEGDGVDEKGASPAAAPQGTPAPEADAARDESAQASIGDLGLIMDIPVTLSMEIGQTRISVSELLKLGKGSVVELQRMADEPMDVLVNGTLVARGEAVVVGERFGIRLIDVISPQERLRKLT